MREAFCLAGVIVFIAVCSLGFLQLFDEERRGRPTRKREKKRGGGKPHIDRVAKEMV